jgi:hypothetical protein
MLQLQETEDRKTPAATTWAAEFLLTVGESREFLGLWVNSGAIHEAKRGRATQVITCSFRCGKWLHMIEARASPRCELCRREGRHGQEASEHLPEETVAHIQSAGCKAQKKASLGLTTGVGSIYSVPSPSMGRRTVNSNSLGKSKIDIVERKNDLLLQPELQQHAGHERTICFCSPSCSSMLAMLAGIVEGLGLQGPTDHSDVSAALRRLDAAGVESSFRQHCVPGLLACFTNSVDELRTGGCESVALAKSEVRTRSGRLYGQDGHIDDFAAMMSLRP